MHKNACGESIGPARHRVSLCCALSYCLLLSLPVPVWAGGFFAGKLNADNIHLLPEGGLDAIGGVGDWLVSNGRTCAVVSGVGHSSYLSLEGASLVDLWHCDLANDQWITLHQQYNLDKSKIPPASTIRALLVDADSSASGSREAVLRVEGALEGINSVREYRLAENAPETLFISTSLQRVAEGEPLKMFGATVLHPRGAMAAFTIDTEQQQYSIGFNQPSVDTTKHREILASVIPADLKVLVGARRIEPGISYGLKLDSATLSTVDGEEKTLHQFT